MNSPQLPLHRALQLGHGEVVAFVGGGGKTSAMFRLARELAASRPEKPVLVTTSTRIFAAQIKQAPAVVAVEFPQLPVADLLPRLLQAAEGHGQVLLVGQVDSDSGKAFGVPPETIDALAASGQFSAILVEADGSRMRPFKAPAPHEPVIPASASVVVPVIGIDVLGQPLSDKTVHRAELVNQLSGLPLGQPITPQTVQQVIAHPEGGLKNVPPQARLIPLINKVETEASLVAARQMAALLLKQGRIAAVAIGAVRAKGHPIAELHSRVAAIVLAAGGSSRFGSPKQLARWQGKTFLEQTVDTALASQAGPVVVVLGAEVERCRALLKARPVEIVINDDWASGQSRSMQAGLAALPTSVRAAIFLLVDLPGVSAGLLDQLIERHRQTLAPLVWPEYEGKRGNPVLFDAALFDELAQVQGDTGGKPVLLHHAAQAQRVAVTSRAILDDFDRPEDLAAAQH